MVKRNLYVLTLEPIETRYTKQWYMFWKSEFKKFFNVIYVDGYSTDVDITDVILDGKFLDINMTNVWKAEQIKKVGLLFSKKQIKDSDIFIFMDAWNFGVTAIKYMIQLNNMKCKMYGYWHAGTYDPADFTAQAGLGSWASHDEVAWLLALDGNFVATQFHKDLILKSYNYSNIEKKIYVVGFPLDWKKYIANSLTEKKNIKNKENIVVFPHRLDTEKHPEVFDKISLQFRNYKFIKTLEVTKTKTDYYNLLAKSKIVFSASKQETFGIGTVEAMMLGCIPIVPNELSYKEMYDDMFKYENGCGARSKMEYAMNHYGQNNHMMNVLKENQEKIQKQSMKAIPKMAIHMLRK